MVGDDAEQAEDGPRPGDEDALGALRWHWGDAYEIEAPGGRWRAKRLDGLGGWIEPPGDAPGPDGLAVAISENYGMKPVPRDDGART
jgi:hypothetical protein